MASTQAPARLQYLPIEPGKGFRVLIVHQSSEFDADIVCELLHATLDDFPPYEALSYVWGRGPKLRYVILDGHKIDITVNLELALRHLRKSDGPRHLWVDALCINQADLKERSSHVGYMIEVYARCTMDILWLGESKSVLENAAKEMKHFGTIMQMDDAACAGQHFDSEETMDRMDRITDLFADQPIWRRVWIMQEISGASNVILIAGKLTMTWSEVERFLDADEYIKSYGMPDAFHGPFGHDMSIRSFANGRLAYPQILSHQRRVSNGQSKVYSSTLLDTLARFRFTRSTDPRDKIYALLGLCSDDLGIKVDYSKSVREVYIDCARRLIKQSRCLDLICQAPWQLHGNEKRRPELPSWVPDFSNPGDTRILFAQRDIYNAGGEFVDAPLDINEDGVVELHGAMLGTLCIVRGNEDSHERRLPSAPGARIALQWMPDSLIREGLHRGNTSLQSYLKGDTEPVDAIDAATRLQNYYRTLTLDCARYPTRRLNSSELLALDKLYNDWISVPLDGDRSELDYDVQNTVMQWGKWTFAVLSGGLYCRVPVQAQPGDELVILRGAKVPVVLRSTSGAEGQLHDHYKFIGPCYVHGRMDGEALHELDDRTKRRVFSIA